MFFFSQHIKNELYIYIYILIPSNIWLSEQVSHSECTSMHEYTFYRTCDELLHQAINDLTKIFDCIVFQS